MEKKIHLFRDDQTWGVNLGETVQCSRPCLPFLLTLQQTRSIGLSCPVRLSSGTKDLQPRVHVSCDISTWGKVRVPRPPHREREGWTLSLSQQMFPVQNVQIHAYSLTRASKWFSPSTISVPRGGESGKKKTWQHQHVLSTVTRSRQWSQKAQWRRWQLSPQSSGLNAQHVYVSVQALDCMASLLRTGERSIGLVEGVTANLSHMIHDTPTTMETRHSVGGTWFRLMSCLTQGWRPQRRQVVQLGSFL